MISHLLDTDTLTLFQHGHPKVSARCAVAPPGTLAITIISMEEQFLAGTPVLARPGATTKSLRLMTA